MEVIGAAAATIQLVELLTKSLISISRLYRRLADAPDYVQRANDQLNQFIALLTLLQPCIKFASFTQASSDIYSILKDCQLQAQELSEILDCLLSEQSKTNRRFSWCSVKSLQKQEKIVQVVSHLERHKSTLTLWVAVVNQSSLTRIESALENLRLIYSGIPVEEAKVMESKRIPKVYDVQLHGKREWHPSRSKSYGVTCTCSAKQVTIVRDYWANTQLRSSFINHKPSCPCTDICERRFFVPSSLLRYALQGSLLSYYMNGRYSFVHNFTCHRIVDELTSPAFSVFARHFDLASRNKRLLLPNIVYDAETTLDSLGRCFQEGQASPFDINQYGQTLLNVALQFFWELFRADSLEYRDFARTIRFLVQMGVPLNEHGLREGTPAGMISSLEENLMPRDDIFGESRQLLLVKHFLDEGGDYEENDDFIQYTGHNLGCSLFSMLPEFFEAANTSQAAKAVMDKDLVKLDRVIKSGSDIDRVNAWGTNAVLNARNYAPALKMLLDAGAEPHTANKGGWNALSGAVAWHDRECINLLLDYDTAVTGLEILFGILAVREPEVQQDILDALANRRTRLRKLASCHLTAERYAHLGLDEQRPLDSRARAVIEALEARGVVIPPSLEIYSKKSSRYNHPPEPVYVLATTQSETYHLEPLQIEAHQLLIFFESIHSAGFYEIDVYSKDGLTPLMLCCSKGQWQAAFWLLNKIKPQIPRTMFESTLNAFHCFAQWFGELHGKTWMSPPSRMKNLMSELRQAGVRADQSVYMEASRSENQLLEVDGSPCYCCPDGQTAIVTFAKELAMYLIRAEPAIKTSFFSSKLVHSIAEAWSPALNPSNATSNIDDIYAVMMRQDIFNRIGLTHTCLNLQPLVLGTVPEQPFDDDEVKEIRDEEEELAVQLEDFMASYLRQRSKYEGTRVEFHRDWVLGLPDYMAL